MRRNPRALQDKEFDLVVIGGGITGACVAHDAALRGLDVALVERGDFGGATSAASSKLLHGGVRYLQQVQLGKVRESAVEQAHFQVIAPHLTRYVPFLVPTYRDLARSRVPLRAGLGLYRLIVAGADRGIRDPAKRIPRPRFYGRAALGDILPDLAATPDITGAQLLYESHIYNSERMTLAFIKAAASEGASVCNYTPVVDFVTDGRRVRSVRVRDELAGEELMVRARLVVNAAGPWIGRINARLGLRTLHRNVLDFAKGTHIVTRRLTGDYGVVLSTRQKIQSLIGRGGRHVFVIPWRSHSLIGTTNTLLRDDLDDVRVTDADVADLIGEVNAALPVARLTPRDVTHAFAGIYPLTDAAVEGLYQVSGRYQVVDHAGVGGIEGIISVLGARYTTARRVAEKAVDLVFRKLGRPSPPCRTASTPVAGGAIADLSRFRAEAIQRYGARVDRETIEHLVSGYGTEIDEVVATDRGARLTRLCPNRESIEAEVAFAAEQEMSVRLADVVFRRTGLGTLGHPGRTCLQRCATIMAEILNWSDARATEETEHVAELFRRLPSPVQPHD